jgi:hypothetical protein
MPKANPMTSASATIENTTASPQNRLGTSRGATAKPAAAATAACEIAEGTSKSLRQHLLLETTDEWVTH